MSAPAQNALSFAGHHEGADALVAIGRGHRGREGVGDRGRERVEPVGPVQGDDRDRVVAHVESDEGLGVGTHTIVSPPETDRVWPVTNAAPSEARKTTAGATSAGWPIRRIGIPRARLS